MEEMGVNPAGADVVIRMSQKMVEMQNKIELLESEIEQLRRSGDNADTDNNRGQDDTG